MYTEFYCAMEALEDFEECLDLVLKDHSILEEAKGRSGEPSHRMWRQGILLVFDLCVLKNGVASN